MLRTACKSAAQRLRASNTPLRSVTSAVVTAMAWGKHPEIVFPYQGRRVRIKAGLPGLHIHDMRHTVGMRLRKAGVREEAIADILWHTSQGMTAHYLVAQIEELVEALNRVTDERSRINQSLDMIRREREGFRVPKKSS